MTMIFLIEKKEELLYTETLVCTKDDCNVVGLSCINISKRVNSTRCLYRPLCQPDSPNNM